VRCTRRSMSRASRSWPLTRQGGSMTNLPGVCCCAAARRASIMIQGLQYTTLTIPERQTWQSHQTCRYCCIAVPGRTYGRTTGQQGEVWAQAAAAARHLGAAWVVLPCRSRPHCVVRAILVGCCGMLLMVSCRWLLQDANQSPVARMHSANHQATNNRSPSCPWRPPHPTHVHTFNAGPSDNSSNGIQTPTSRMATGPWPC
jgi:hypothetical protein